MEKEILKHVAENYYSQFGERSEINSSHPLGGGCISHALRLETNTGTLLLKWNADGPPDLLVWKAESLKEHNNNIKRTKYFCSK